MKKLSIIPGLSLAIILTISCSDVKRERGRVYMPDMSESRAVETYSDHSNLVANGTRVNYTAMPVPGTVNRGEELPYHLTNDSAGYAQSATYPSPLPKLAQSDLVEAERLFLINCAICHGAALDGNGPLYKGGTGPYPAKPATLVGDPKIEALSEGTIYHVQTYGKNLMGSYASQLTRKQRWMVAQYIKTKQAAAKPAGGSASADSTKGTVAPGATGK